MRWGRFRFGEEIDWVWRVLSLIHRADGEKSRDDQLSAVKRLLIPILNSGCRSDGLD